MNPAEFVIEDTTKSSPSTAYFDLLLLIGRGGQRHTPLDDKSDFNFHITKFPFLSSNISFSPSFFIPNLLRYAGLDPLKNVLFWGQRHFHISFPGQGYVSKDLKSSLECMVNYGILTKIWIFAWTYKVKSTIDQTLGFNLSVIILALLLVSLMLGCRHPFLRHGNISISLVECTFLYIPTSVHLRVGVHSLHFWRLRSDKESYCRDISFSLLSFNSCLYFNFSYMCPLKKSIHTCCFINSALLTLHALIDHSC